MNPSWQATSLGVLVLFAGLACSTGGELGAPSSNDASPGSQADAQAAAPTNPEDAQATVPTAPQDAQDTNPASPPDARPATGYVDPKLANSQVVPAPAREGAQYSGAIALRTTMPTVSTTGEAWVEISAPILPKTPALYPGQGVNYPTTPQGQAQLAHDSALTFETLLGECQAKNPGIVLWKTGDPPLSSEQVNTNYRLLEACAYQYLAKPYWIPQLVKDVDICRQELGAGWHTLTEDDVLALSAQDLQRVQEGLAGVQNPGSSQAGSFLFSMQVWVLRNDGSVAGVNLAPATSPQFVPLTSSNGMPFDPLVHYEGSLALRCLRVTAG
jgi:hypothetical protein